MGRSCCLAFAALLFLPNAAVTDDGATRTPLPQGHAPTSASPVAIRGLSWLGIRARNFTASVRFYEQVLRLKPVASSRDFRAYDLPNGDRIELFSEQESDHRHFTTGPVIGFRVDSVAKARAALEKQGIHFIGPVARSDSDEWAHFTGPDGIVYEITAHRQP